MTVKPIIATPWASTGIVLAPTTPQQSAGWNAALPPITSYFNFKYNQWDNYLNYLNEQGLAEWDAITNYPINAYTKGSNGNAYRAIVANINIDPTTDNGTTWQEAAANAHISSTILTAPAYSLSPAQMNQVYEVDSTLNDIVVTLPDQTLVAKGTRVSFLMVGGLNKLTVKGSGTDLLSDYNSHDFYSKNSTCTVVRYNTKYFIDDYNDADSVFWQAYFGVGQSQTIGGSTLTTVVLPSIAKNIGSSYNNGNGVATLRVRGEWDIVSAICTGLTGNTANAYARLTNYINDLNTAGNSASTYIQASNDFIALTATTSHTTTLNSSDNARCKAAHIRIAENINSSEDGIPAFTGILKKRIV